MDADLVLEGSGIKAIAHVGALGVLQQEHGCRFHRVAGASAGAIVAAFVAAGLAPERMQPLLCDGIQYERVADRGGLNRIPVVGPPLSLVFQKGMYDGDYLHEWVRDTLKAETGAEHFGDLKITDDPGSDLPPGRSYRLVVIVSDVSRGLLVRLPWDYPAYGLDPDRQLIADAVRASASIPVFFKPVRLTWGPPSKNVSYLVDGGALSDFPIEVFDRTDGRQPRWPTFGIKLSAMPEPGELLHEVRCTISLLHSLFDTIVTGHDQVHLADPCVSLRTMFVDTSYAEAADFRLDRRVRDRLFLDGQEAARGFMATWDWEAYRARCGGGAARTELGLAAKGETTPAG